MNLSGWTSPTVFSVPCERVPDRSSGRLFRLSFSVVTVVKGPGTASSSGDALAARSRSSAASFSLLVFSNRRRTRGGGERRQSPHLAWPHELHTFSRAKAVLHSWQVHRSLIRTGLSIRLILLAGPCPVLRAPLYFRPYFSNSSLAFSSESPTRTEPASTGMMGSSVSSKSSTAFSSTSRAFPSDTVGSPGGAACAGATPACSTAGPDAFCCVVFSRDPLAVSVLLGPLREKTFINLSKARPRLLFRLAAVCCCDESSCAPDDMAAKTCQDSRSGQRLQNGRAGGSEVC